jgi:hypothetical protein
MSGAAKVQRKHSVPSDFQKTGWSSARSTARIPWNVVYNTARTPILSSFELASSIPDLEFGAQFSRRRLLPCKSRLFTAFPTSDIYMDPLGMLLHNPFPMRLHPRSGKNPWYGERGIQERSEAGIGGRGLSGNGFCSDILGSLS